MTAGVELSAQQRALLAELYRQAHYVADQLLYLDVVAEKLHCTQADIRAVRDAILHGHTRECGDVR